MPRPEGSPPEITPEMRARVAIKAQQLREKGASTQEMIRMGNKIWRHVADIEPLKKDELDRPS